MTAHSERHVMTAAHRHPSIYEAFLAVPEHLVAEIVRGSLRVFPRPASPHARAATRLGAKLGPFDDRDGPDGWILLDEPEIHLRGDVLVPDLAGWRRSRMPTLPDVPFFELAPDWICEVLSPSTVTTDRLEKMPIYAEWSVSHAWLIDPVAKSLEAYERDDAAWRLLQQAQGSGVVRVPPFDAMDLELGSLWAR